MFKIDSPQLPCRADRQQLCEHCLGQFVQSRNHWSIAFRDRFYEAIEALAIIGKIFFGIAFAVLAVLSYLFPSMMSSSTKRTADQEDWREKREREHEREKEEQLRFEQKSDHFWKSEQHRAIADKSRKAGPGYVSREEYLENQSLKDEIEKNRQFNDLDSMIELEHCLASRRADQADKLRVKREKALYEYKRELERESHLIRELKKRPYDEELRRDRYEASSKADALHKRYQDLCRP